MASSRCTTGSLISPCLPRRSEYNGGVEADIKYVKRNFLPLFREAQKERGQGIPDAGELAEELERWNRESYDLHVVRPARPQAATQLRRSGTSPVARDTRSPTSAPACCSTGFHSRRLLDTATLRATSSYLKESGKQ